MVGQERADPACPETSAPLHMVRARRNLLKSWWCFLLNISFPSLAFPSWPSEMCMPPSPPTQPVVMAVSDTELALSWQQGESEGSSPVLHFLVAYIRLVIIDSSASLLLLIHSHAFYRRVPKCTDAITHMLHTSCITMKPAIIQALRRRRAAGNVYVMEKKSRTDWKPQAGKRTTQKPLC